MRTPGYLSMGLYKACVLKQGAAHSRAGERRTGFQSARPDCVDFLHGRGLSKATPPTLEDEIDKRSLEFRQSAAADESAIRLITSFQSIRHLSPHLLAMARDRCFPSHGEKARPKPATRDSVMCLLTIVFIGVISLHRPSRALALHRFCSCCVELGAQERRIRAYEWMLFAGRCSEVIKLAKGIADVAVMPVKQALHIDVERRFVCAEDFPDDRVE